MRYVKIIAAAIALTATAANAEYMVKIPLEVNNGGFLPVGSIVFKGGNTGTPSNPSTPSVNPSSSAEACMNSVNLARNVIESYGWIYIKQDYLTSEDTGLPPELDGCITQYYKNTCGYGNWQHSNYAQIWDAENIAIKNKLVSLGFSEFQQDMLYCE